MFIFVEYSIDCAHFLPNVSEEHKCRRPHGHRYEIRLEISGGVGVTTGWVIDYAVVKQLADPLVYSLDHRMLNEISGLENPTCEKIVEYLRDGLTTYLPELSGIEVRETARAGAGWRK